MNSILLASAMICTITRIPDNSCRQCCETETISACKYISKCPKTEEEKQVEHQRKIEEQYLQLQIQQEKTKQMELENKAKQQEK